jgi:ABC-type glutathione transport system ATPase component
MVAGLESVSGGRILIGETDVTLRAANERNVSMVFQSYALFPHMTVLENVCYGPMSMRMDKAKAKELAHAKLAMLGLTGLEGAVALRALRRPAAARRGRALARARARRCCCSTSRCRTSMRSCGAACGRRSASCSNRSRSPSSTSRTTRRKRSPSPIGSS